MRLSDDELLLRMYASVRSRPRSLPVVPRGPLDIPTSRTYGNAVLARWAPVHRSSRTRLAACLSGVRLGRLRDCVRRSAT